MAPLPPVYAYAALFLKDESLRDTFESIAYEFQYVL